MNARQEQIDQFCKVLENGGHILMHPDTWEDMSDARISDGVGFFANTPVFTSPAVARGEMVAVSNFKSLYRPEYDSLRNTVEESIREARKHRLSLWPSIAESACGNFWDGFWHKYYWGEDEIRQEEEREEDSEVHGVPEVDGHEATGETGVP